MFDDNARLVGREWSACTISAALIAALTKFRISMILSLSLYIHAGFPCRDLNAYDGAAAIPV